MFQTLFHMPQSMRQRAIRLLMVEEARKALEAYARGDMAAYNTHRLNARAIAQELEEEVRS